MYKSLVWARGCALQWRWKSMCRWHPATESIHSAKGREWPQTGVGTKRKTRNWNEAGWVVRRPPGMTPEEKKESPSQTAKGKCPVKATSEFPGKDEVKFRHRSGEDVAGRAAGQTGAGPELDLSQKSGHRWTFLSLEVARSDLYFPKMT